MNVELVGLSIENIRGFRLASVDLRPERLLLVGPNNSGKTSLLLLLGWVLNECTPELLLGRRKPDSHTLDTLVPARETRNKARRLIVHVRISDGRSAKKYNCDANKIVKLRFNVRKSPSFRVYARVDRPTRGEERKTDEGALELFTALQRRYKFVHVPSFRDVSSARFQSTLTDLFREKMQEKALHKQPGGAPAEYRVLKKVSKELEKLAADLTKPIWDEMKSSLPPGMVRQAEARLDATQQDLIDWMASRLALRLSTGSHDERTVAPAAVGAGLQSLLDLAVARSREEDAGQHTIIAIEEPEAFLHPSAQRVMARKLFSLTNIEKTIVTTHSRTMVEEIKFSQITIVNQHRFYRPSDMSSRRESINTSLLSGDGAEVMFSESVLLVEGPGDREFFEEVRRRMAAVDTEGALDRICVVAVGGKQSFGPWLKMIESLRTSNLGRPIAWTLVADADAPCDVVKALSESKNPLTSQMAAQVQDVKQKLSANDINGWIKSARDVNRALRDKDVRVQFMPADLEYAVLSGVSEPGFATIRNTLGMDGCDNREALIKKLGSKGIDGRASDSAAKSPYMRSLIAKALPATDFSADIKRIVEIWADPVLSSRKVQKLLGQV